MATPSQLNGFHSSTCWTSQPELINIKEANKQSFKDFDKQTILNILTKVNLASGGILECINSINFSITSKSSSWEISNIIDFFNRYEIYLPLKLDCIKTINFEAWEPDLIISFLTRHKHRLLPNFRISSDRFNMGQFNAFQNLIHSINTASFSSTSNTASSSSSSSHFSSSFSSSSSTSASSSSSQSTTSSMTCSSRRGYSKENINKIPINEILRELANIDDDILAHLDPDQFLEFSSHDLMNIDIQKFLRSLSVDKIKKIPIKAIQEHISRMGVYVEKLDYMNHIARLGEYTKNFTLEQLRKLRINFFHPSTIQFLDFSALNKGDFIFISNFFEVCEGFLSYLTPTQINHITKSLPAKSFSSLTADQLSHISYLELEISIRVEIDREKAIKMRGYVFESTSTSRHDSEIFKYGNIDKAHPDEVIKNLYRIDSASLGRLSSTQLFGLKFEKMDELSINKFLKSISDDRLVHLNQKSLFDNANKIEPNLLLKLLRHYERLDQKHLLNFRKCSFEQLQVLKASDFPIESFSEIIVRDLGGCNNILRFFEGSEKVLKQLATGWQWPMNASYLPSKLFNHFSEKELRNLNFNSFQHRKDLVQFWPLMRGYKSEGIYPNISYDPLMQILKMGNYDFAKLSNISFDSFNAEQIKEVINFISEGLIQNLSLETIQKNISKMAPEAIVKLAASQIGRLDINTLSIPQLLALKTLQFTKPQIESLNLERFSKETFLQFFGSEGGFPAGIEYITSDIQINKAASFMPGHWFVFFDTPQLRLVNFKELTKEQQREIDDSVAMVMKDYFPKSSTEESKRSAPEVSKRPMEREYKSFSSFSFESDSKRAPLSETETTGSAKKREIYLNAEIKFEDLVQILKAREYEPLTLSLISFDRFDEIQINEIINLIPKEYIDELLIETIQKNIQKISPQAFLKLSANQLKSIDTSNLSSNQLDQFKLIDFSKLSIEMQTFIPHPIGKLMNNYYIGLASMLSSFMRSTDLMHKSFSSTKNPVYPPEMETSHSRSSLFSGISEVSVKDIPSNIKKSQANQYNLSSWSQEDVIEFSGKIFLQDLDSRSLTCLNTINFGRWGGTSVMSLLTYFKGHLPSTLESVKTINFSDWTPFLIKRFFESFNDLFPSPLANINTINFSNLTLEDRIRLINQGKNTYVKDIISLDWNHALFAALCDQNEEIILLSRLKEDQISLINFDGLTFDQIGKILERFAADQISKLNLEMLRRNKDRIPPRFTPKLKEVRPEIYPLSSSSSSSSNRKTEEGKANFTEPRPSTSPKRETPKTLDEVHQNYVWLKQKISENDPALDYNRIDLFDDFSSVQIIEIFNLMPLDRIGELSSKGIQNNIRNINSNIIQQLPLPIRKKLDLNSFSRAQIAELNASLFSDDQINKLNFLNFDSPSFYNFFKGEDCFFKKSIRIPNSKLKHIPFNEMTDETMNKIMKWLPVEWFSLSYLKKEQLAAMHYTSLGAKQMLIDRRLASQMRFYIAPVFTRDDFAGMLYESMLFLIKEPDVRLDHLPLELYDMKQISEIFELVPGKVPQIGIEAIKKSIKKIGYDVVRFLHNDQLRQIDINQFYVGQITQLRAYRFLPTQIESLRFPPEWDPTSFGTFFTPQISNGIGAPDPLINNVRNVDDWTRLLPTEWYKHLSDRILSEIDYNKVRADQRSHIAQAYLKKMRNYTEPRTGYGYTSGGYSSGYSSGSSWGWGAHGSTGYSSGSGSSSSSSGSSGAHGSSSSSSSSSETGKWTTLETAYKASLSDAQRKANETDKYERVGTDETTRFYNEIRKSIRVKGNDFNPKRFFAIWMEISTKRVFNDETFFRKENLEQIKDFGKKIWLAIHPDKNPEDTAFATEIVKAFNTVKNYYEELYRDQA